MTDAKIFTVAAVTLLGLLISEYSGAQTLRCTTWNLVVSERICERGTCTATRTTHQGSGRCSETDQSRYHSVAGGAGLRCLCAFRRGHRTRRLSRRNLLCIQGTVPKRIR